MPVSPSPAAPLLTGISIAPADITGVVLAGGKGTRMGGMDKGLQLFHGIPLAQHALHRLQRQVGPSCISANRHLDDYGRFGVPVLPDTLADFAGPLAGLAAALRHCRTPYLVTVPCDVPLFPDSLVASLSEALVRNQTPVAVAEAAGYDALGAAQWRLQPTFCLMRVQVLDALEQFLAQGQRKVGAWLAQQAAATARFGDAGVAFANANTPAELQALQT